MNNILNEIKTSKPEKTIVEISENLKLKVLEQLGKPRDLKKIVIHNVYGTRYRVNVWREIKENMVIITDSFFFIVTNNGDIVFSSPKLIKKY